ncbi:hypothetical protein [Dapis sp. BLCC M229]|uniref:hypothetical protein n=1 Tax=Dapis sp. BLCC M229 TaxID=3400188 RepID=UPI003CEAEACA
MVWVVQEKEFHWFIFQEGEYHRQKPDEAGYLKSYNFSGLCLDVKALLDGQIQKVLLVLPQGIEPKNISSFWKIYSTALRTSQKLELIPD